MYIDGDEQLKDESRLNLFRQYSDRAHFSIRGAIVRGYDPNETIKASDILGYIYSGKDSDRLVIRPSYDVISAIKEHEDIAVLGNNPHDIALTTNAYVGLISENGSEWFTLRPIHPENVLLEYIYDIHPEYNVHNTDEYSMYARQLAKEFLSRNDIIIPRNMKNILHDYGY
ncbi:hypothetical protein ABGV42_01780 [Paenibacillus pabuli]|uniref:hypothetical protein n=1 Tax=Paenibacillus pabuli TaxID=1472 RepID=UPI003241C068